ncbi:hypothetical protein JW998_08290, partial [candidate division KSB1 bacterium]|nr:hypothetical protein [candidate division KSB1 bacterium]
EGGDAPLPIDREHAVCDAVEDDVGEFVDWLFDAMSFLANQPYRGLLARYLFTIFPEGYKYFILRRMR